MKGDDDFFPAGLVRSSGPYFVELTAPAVGAVSVIRVAGAGALEVADAVFRPLAGSPLRETEPGRPRVGHVGAGLGDEVVALVIGDEVEIQCHGGRQAVELVTSALRSAGAEGVDPDRWAFRIAPGRIEGEAAALLGKASTLRTAEILRDQQDGALRAALAGILERWDDPGRTREALDELIALGEIGARLVSGWAVALAGRPNVGKSSLMNALAGFDRAIVADRPGTTRDAIAQETAVDGWPVRLVDTAGLRDSDDPIESAGIERAREQQARADLVLVVLDRSMSLTPDDRALLDAHPSALAVLNKSDLPGAWDAGEIPCPTVEVSAVTGAGIEGLLDEIARRLVPRPPAPGAAVPFRGRMVERLREIRGRLDESGRRMLEGWLSD